MAIDVTTLKCPSCGAPVGANDSRCPYCGSSLYIQSFTNVYDLDPAALNMGVREFDEVLHKAPGDAAALFSRGCLNLRLGLYPKAERDFARAIQADFNAPEAYLYHAVSLARGKHIDSVGMSTLEEMKADIQAGLATGDVPGLYLLWCIIQQYCYEARGLIARPSSDELYEKACRAGATQTDVDYLYGLLAS